MNKIEACWITLNRACNLRCSYCYTNDLGFKKEMDMKFDDFLKIVKFCKEASINHITLIGGEPTVYTHLKECIKILNNEKLDFVIVTNGILFSDEKYLNELIEAGLDKAGVISISLKEVNEEKYKEVTGFEGFEKTLTAFKKLKDLGIRTTFSFVITPENVSRYLEGIKAFMPYNDENSRVGLSICYDFNETGVKNKNYLKEWNYPQFINNFVKTLDELNNITNGNWNLQCGIPRCLINKEDFDKIKKHTYVGCQLIDGWGLVFDTDLTIIPCNSSFKTKIGKFGEDFVDYESFVDYMNSEKVSFYLKYIRSLPHKICLDCELLADCKGGCLSYWSQFSMEDILEFKKRQTHLINN